MSEGHPQAWFYPISQVYAEARLATHRINRKMANEAGLWQMAISTIPNQSMKEAARKKAVKAFEKRLKDLTDGET